MPRILLPSEALRTLNEAEGEELFAWFRPSQPVSIVAGIITIPGTGRYHVAVESGTSDDVTGITVTAEVIEGARIELRPAVNGHTINFLHQGGLHLSNGQTQSLTTDRSTIEFWHDSGGTEWNQKGTVSYVP